MARKKTPLVALKNRIRNSIKPYRTWIKRNNEMLRDDVKLAYLATVVGYCEELGETKVTWGWSDYSATLYVHIKDYTPEILSQLCTMTASGYEISGKYARNENTIEVHYAFKNVPMTVVLNNVPGPGEGDKCKIVRTSRVAEDFALVCAV